MSNSEKVSIEQQLSNLQQRLENLEQMQDPLHMVLEKPWIIKPSGEDDSPDDSQSFIHIHLPVQPANNRPY